ncbi:MAG: hypothetical protein AAF750_18130 [Planctomycetota bacterium]
MLVPLMMGCPARLTQEFVILNRVDHPEDWITIDTSAMPEGSVNLESELTHGWGTEVTRREVWLIEGPAVIVIRPIESESEAGISETTSDSP